MFLNKINLLDLNTEELQKFFLELGEKPFRALQVMQWIYHYYCDDFDCMTNLSKALRQKLYQVSEIRAPVINAEQISIDKTVKWSMLVDNQKIETVYIPVNMRATLCISSQIGCALGCSFCGTAQQGFNRNLSVSEIIGQVWRIAKLISLNKRRYNNISITHVVLMGMGEPLLNLRNVVSAIKIMLDEYGFKFSKQHVTLSTAGIVPAIDKLKDMINIPLAISLHAPNNTIRDSIMPINKKYNIEVLLAAVHRYLIKSKRFNIHSVTIEYVLLTYVNDEVFHAHQLVKLLKYLPCKVNLIPWNSIPNISYTCSSNTRINSFLQVLLKYNIITTIRKIRGSDINAACGQLSGEVINRVSLRYY